MTSFIISDGWKEKLPIENQLLAPFAVCPMKNNSNNNPEKIKNAVTKTSVLFRNLKSTKESPKRKMKETTIQINCCLRLCKITYCDDK